MLHGWRCRSLWLGATLFALGCTRDNPYDCAPLFDEVAPQHFVQGPHVVSGAVNGEVAALLIAREGAAPEVARLDSRGWLGPVVALDGSFPSDQPSSLVASSSGGFAAVWVAGGSLVLQRLDGLGQAEGTAVVVPTAEALPGLRLLFGEDDAVKLVWEGSTGLHLTTFGDDDAVVDVAIDLPQQWAPSARFAWNGLALAMAWKDGTGTVRASVVDAAGKRVEAHELDTPSQSTLQLARDGAGFVLYDTHADRGGAVGVERLDQRAHTRMARVEIGLGAGSSSSTAPASSTAPSWFGGTAARFRRGSVFAGMREGTGGPLVHVTDFHREVVDSFDMMRNPGQGVQFGAMTPRFVILEDRLLLWWQEFHEPATDYQGFLQLSNACDGG